MMIAARDKLLQKECSSLGVSTRYAFPLRWGYGGTGRSEILFELSKIFRNAPHANF